MRLAHCPNTKVEIDMVDKSQFFLRPYHVKEKDKKTLNKGSEKISPYGNSLTRLLNIFKPSNAYQQQINPG